MSSFFFLPSFFFLYSLSFVIFFVLKTFLGAGGTKKKEEKKKKKKDVCLCEECARVPMTKSEFRSTPNDYYSHATFSKTRHLYKIILHTPEIRRRNSDSFSTEILLTERKRIRRKRNL